MCNKCAKNGCCTTLGNIMTKCLLLLFSLIEKALLFQYSHYIAKILFLSIIKKNRSRFCFQAMYLKLFFCFVIKKRGKNICFTEKCCTFASHLGIGLWCNGNTTDSGPVIQGSSPCSPTKSFSYTGTLFLSPPQKTGLNFTLNQLSCIPLVVVLSCSFGGQKIIVQIQYYQH